MAKNTLSARLEVLGGEKLVRTFREIGGAAARSFDRIDREADQAARRVRALERELARLKAISSNIRARIKVEEDKDNLDPRRREQLKRDKQLADDLDARAASIRNQIGDIDDALTEGRGQAFRALARDLDRDRLETVRTAEMINDKLDDLRKNRGDGSVISDQDIKDLERASTRLAAVSDNWIHTNQRNLEKIEDQERRAHAKRERDAERFRKAEEDKVRVAEAERQRAAERLAETQRRAAAEEEQRLARQRDAVRRISDEWRQVAEARRKGQLSSIEKEERRNRRAPSAGGLLGIDVGPRREFDKILGSGLFTAEQQSQLRKMDNALRGVSTRLSLFRRTLGYVRGDTERGINSSGLVRDLGGIAKGMDRSYRKTTQFISAYRQFELAIGNAALKTGVAGVLGGLGLGIGALGGVAVAGGIAGAGGLAAFDGAALKRTAQMVGVTTDEFSKLRFSADKVGVGIDSVAGSLSALRARIAEVAATDKDDLDPLLKSLEDGNNAWKVRLSLVKRSASALDMGQQVEQAKWLSSNLMAGIPDDVTGKERAAALQEARAKLQRELNALGNGEARRKAPWLFQAPELHPDGSEKEVSAYEQERRKKVEEELKLSYKAKAEARDTMEVFWELFDLFARIPDLEGKVQMADVLGVTEILPLLTRSRAEIEQMFRDAEYLGVAVSDANADKMQKTREQLYDAWAAIIGLGYQLAIDMAPHIERLMRFIVSWIATNRNDISKFLVEVYEWIGNAIADFIRLFKQGGEASTYFNWTKNLYNGLVAIKDGAVAFWEAIKKGYQIAKPALDAIGEALGLGPDSGFEVAIGYLIANVLGVIGIVHQIGGTFATAFRLAAAAIGSLFMPVISLVLKGLAAVVGWPLLLLGGTGLVALYWDDIVALFSKAWELFKSTFPETAAVLEEAFQGALEPVQWLIDLISGILKPVKMVFDAIAALFNYFTGWDISGTGLMIGLAALLTLVVKVTNAVQTLMTALGFGAAASAAGGIAGRAAGGAVAGAVAGGAARGGLIGALGMLMSPTGAVVIAGIGLGVLIHQIAEATGVAQEFYDWLDSKFFANDREANLALYRQADELHQQGLKKHGTNPYQLNMNNPTTQKQWKDFLLKASGAATGIDVWRDGSLERFMAKLDSIQMPANFRWDNVTFDRPQDGYGMTARPVIIPLWGGGEIIAYSYDKDIENKLNQSKRAKLSSAPGWERRR